MAFDLVDYFSEQINIQKPQLLNQYPAPTRTICLSELNVLSLGKLVTLWQTDPHKLYNEIQTQDELYIEEVSRHLTTSQYNESILTKPEFEQSIAQILSLQLTELKQLDHTAQLGRNGFNELFKGQLEHLQGQAPDWVWSTNQLIELKGSQPKPQEQISLQATIKEFNHMANSSHDHVEIEISTPAVPKWSHVLEPIVALVILWILWNAVSQIFA